MGGCLMAKVNAVTRYLGPTNAGGAGWDSNIGANQIREKKQSHQERKEKKQSVKRQTLPMNNLNFTQEPIQLRCDVLPV